jgi:hypothetical protein
VGVLTFVWVCLVIFVLVFNVFCIVCIVFNCFVYVYLLFVLSVLVQGLLPLSENSIAISTNNNYYYYYSANFNERVSAFQTTNVVGQFEPPTTRISSPS